MTEHYIPPKIKQLGNEYQKHHDFQKVSLSLRQNYTSLCSYNTALTRLRAYLISTNDRHPGYTVHLESLEKQLVEEYISKLNSGGSEINTDDETTKCLKFLYDFRDVPLRRQLNIITKLKKGQMSVPCKAFLDSMISFPLLPEYISVLQLSRDEHNELVEQTQKHEAEVSSNVLIITDPNVLVQKCISIICDRNEETPTEYLCTALALLTGRRTIEVLLTGSFELIRHKKYHVLFTGQVKTGLQNIKTVKDDEHIPLCIPVLAPGQVLQPCLVEVQARVRKQLGEDVTKEQVNQRMSHKLSKTVKVLIHPKIRFHDLRTLYALISYEAFKPHTYGLNGWVQACLGHTSVKMSTHYTRMQIGNVKRITRSPNVHT